MPARLSLFAPRPMILAGACGGCRPSQQSSDEQEDVRTSRAGRVSRTIHRPDTVLVIDCARFDFDGEDKARSGTRREVFFGGASESRVPSLFCLEAARSLGAEASEGERASNWGSAELALLIEATGGDASRIATEIEKLRRFAGPGRKVTAEDIAVLVPDAQSSTIFVLSSCSRARRPVAIAGSFRYA